jgi:hypothetical protein
MAVLFIQRDGVGGVMVWSRTVEQVGRDMETITGDARLAHRHPIGAGMSIGGRLSFRQSCF